jgi:AcrR family transcriptional regulator
MTVPALADSQPARAATRTPLAKAEQARRTRALIIRTGIACVARYGYAQTTMLLISKEAKISRGPLHYHFADKNDLMGAIAATIPSAVDAATMARLNAAKTIREKVQAIIDVALEQHLGDHHIVALELLTAARRDQGLAAAIVPHIAASERRVDEWWIAFASELGWSDLRMRAFRTVMVAALRGLAIDHNAGVDRAQHTEALQLYKDMLIRQALSG